MRLRSLSLIVALLGAPAASFAQTPDPSLAGMAREIEAMHARDMAGPAPNSGGLGKGEGSGGGLDAKVGSAASTLDNIFSASSAIGGAINTAFGDMFGNASSASSLLDNLIDGALEPNLDGYTGGRPDIPYSQCDGRKEGGVADCQRCFASAGENLAAARYDLEKLRVAGLATKNYVSSRIALGDGLSGMTGMAALEWQRQRRIIEKQFDKFKITYDGKYDEFMNGLKRAMARFDACESEFGERDWYNRFGFLYVQFMGDKYKRNF